MRGNNQDYSGQQHHHWDRHQSNRHLSDRHRSNRRNVELSVLSRGLPPPPPSPAALLGFGCQDDLLVELTNRTKYTIAQRNGQRIYGLVLFFARVLNKNPLPGLKIVLFENQTKPKLIFKVLLVMDCLS